MMRWILRRLRREDEGMALATVLGMGVVLTALIAMGLALSTSGTVRSGNDRDNANAMAAAYAGLADYQSRLTLDNTYWNYGVSTPFGGASVFTGDKGNAAFTTTTGGAWVPVPASASTEWFRYEVDNSKFAYTGAVRIRVTGRAGQATKSIVASLKGTGFINYLYFTDYESSNPAITGETQVGSNALCLSQHMTDPGYDANKACNPVNFIQKDKLLGPVRTNDQLTICGATFSRQVQSTAADGVYNKSCGTDAVFQQKSPTNPQPKQVSSWQFPETNTNMIQEARYDVAGTTPGCLYTGPTSIDFTSDGYMTVKSPWSLATQIAIDGTGKMTGRSTGVAATQCGSIADLHSSTGAKVKVLSSNLVYVKSVPTASSQPANKDPNWWQTGSVPSAPSGAKFCQVGSSYGNGLGYPMANEYAGPAGYSALYGCRNGDAFVDGDFDGTMTIGVQNTLYVTGNIKYVSTDDVLGLVGQTSVSVWNPVQCLDYEDDGTCDTDDGDSVLRGRSGGANLEIDAAIASNAGTFQVQNYRYGAQLGTLTVKGSIAQKWRGAVGVTYSSGGTTRQTGFTKNYGYDDRLRDVAPPKFLKPVQTVFNVATQIEVKPAYLADGTRVS